ncbi:MAG TPA: CBS domain-containing protein [Myxococcaceae bacterium]|nr:CBS domain-containing protein [Myxococcaceae bacterium]
MLTAADMMSRDPVAARMTDSLSTAVKLFQTHSVHHLPVVERGKLVGLVTREDCLRARVNGAHAGTVLKDLMTHPVLTVTPETPLRATLDRLLERRFGCLPVVEADGALVGIITSTDFARMSRHHIDELDAEELAREWEH